MVCGNLIFLWFECYWILCGVVNGFVYFYNEFFGISFIVYWDLKFVNILLDDGYEVKFGDFGLVVIVFFKVMYVIIEVFVGIIGFIVLEYY